MSENFVVPIALRAVVPTSGGTAIFLGHATGGLDKVLMICIDNSIGAAIAMHLGGVTPPRPLTHDLIERMLLAFGARVERVVINDFRDNTYYARLILSEENEVKERKVVELDARPSDSLALALRMKAPMFVSRRVWDEVSDAGHLLREMEESGGEGLIPGGGDWPGESLEGGDDEEEG